MLAVVCAIACSGRVSVENDVAIAIAAPIDGALVTRADDVDTEMPGIQLNIVVDVAGAIDGTEVLLGTDTYPAAVVEVTDGQAIFPAFTLPRGDVTLTATTRTCNTVGCIAGASLFVVDSDTKVAISVPEEGDVVATGDVAVTIVRTSGAMPTSCSVTIDGSDVGNFIWDDIAQPLVVASTLREGPHTARALCYESRDVIATQTVGFVVDGTAPTEAPVLVSEAAAPGSLDFDTPGALVDSDTADVSPDAGLQHPVTVAVDSGGESHRKWSVRLSVTPPGGPETIYAQVMGDGNELVRVTFPAVDFGASDGAIDFRVMVYDSVGRASPADTATLVIDRAPPPTVSVEPPVSAPYTVANADVGVVISDARGGGTLVLESYASSVGGSPVVSTTRGPLAAGAGPVVFPSFPLPQGLSYLQATFTDASGHTAVSERVLYGVDAVGPTLTLGVRTAAGAVQSCDTPSCLADTSAFDPATRRIRLDRDASVTTCGGFGPCSADGTDLFFTLGDCVNSDTSLETCPVTVRLQSRLVGELDWDDVVGGTFTSGDATLTSIVGNLEFEPGAARELRLVTEDSNHNAAASGSVFLTMNFVGVVVAVERLDAGMNSVGDALDNDRYFGIAENVLAPGAGRFQTNLRAHLDAYGAVPTTVRLAVDTISGTASYDVPTVAGGTVADLAAAELTVATDPASPATNTLTVQAMCGPDVCGSRVFTGIVADIAAPTYQFDRCALCALNVPLVGGGCPGACSSGNDADPNDNIAGPGSFAVWNLALDADHDGGNGFNAMPLAVKIGGLEDGRPVRLDTDLGTLSGNVTSATGCPSAATCRATFAALTASQLAGTEVRRVSVSFSDRAGNPAVPDAVRIDAAHESIYARTDVIAPAGVAPSACIGESTVPASGGDAATVEAASCAAACGVTGACNRTAASAALTWAAPGDDGTTSGSVVSYVIGIAALGIPYGGTTYTSCAELGTAGPFETTSALPGTPLSAGGIEQLAVPGLYPHRDYCFLVVATDDVGNSSPAGSFVARRKIPLVTTPAIQPFDGIVRNDAQAVGAFHGEPSQPPDYGAFATSLPDLDGDGRDDFAVTQLTSGSVQVYLSGAGAFTPAVTINAPAIAYSGSFGAAVAGGDFDGDGAHDLVICDPTLTTSSMAGGGARGGALFLYYGVAGSGITRNVNTTTPQVPSLHPDVSLLGSAGAELCANLQLGDIDGDHVDDLVATTGLSAPAPTAYVIMGGARARFASGPQAFAVEDADLLVASSAPARLVLGDYDADGIDEIAIAEVGAIAVYDGATLITTVTYPGAFSGTLLTVRGPSAVAGDWLLAGTSDASVVVLATGFLNDVYPLASYVTLDATSWSGAPAPGFGAALASLGDFDGNGGVDVAVGTSGSPASAFVYSLDTTSGAFAKRAILQGPSGFASTLVGLRAYAPGSALTRSQLLVVQRGAARLFLFR